jgi:hypothetical protein
MPVFISYSHSDKAFATRLAANLVKRKASIWMDDWEVSAGESLIERIQEAIQSASALVIVLSKASVASVWCKKEVVAAIQRELEERRVIVIPVLLEACDVPLFLRDKKYADFRKDFDQGFATVLAAIAKVTNPAMGRRTGPKDYHTDWSYDWGYVEGRLVIKFFVVQHSVKSPFSVLSIIQLATSEEATRRYRAYEAAGLDDLGRLVIVDMVVEALEGREFTVILEDNFPRRKEFEFFDPQRDLGCAVMLESRRLGDDTGRDVLIHGADEIRRIAAMVRSRIKQPSAEELERLMLAMGVRCGGKIDKTKSAGKAPRKSGKKRGR